MGIPRTLGLNGAPNARGPSVKTWITAMMSQPPSQPTSDAMNPMSAASMKNSLTTKLSRAPRHFIVPISLNRSVTDMSIEFMMPTKQTSSAITASATNQRSARVGTDR